MANFFELSTPRDMLQKALREHQRMQASLNVDNVFNFFVTTHHISDYVEKSGAVPKADLQTFLSDDDLKFSRDLCDKAKHLRLDRRPYSDPSTGVWSGLVGGAPLGSVMINSGEVYVLFVDDHSRAVDVQWLASRVIDKWEHFLSQYGL